jgi:predicted ATPase
MKTKVVMNDETPSTELLEEIMEFTKGKPFILRETTIEDIVNEPASFNEEDDGPFQGFIDDNWVMTIELV